MKKTNDNFFVIYDERDFTQRSAMAKAEEYFRENPGDPDIIVDGFFILNRKCNYDCV